MAIIINRFNGTPANFVETLKTQFNWVNVDETNPSDIRLYFSEHCYVGINYNNPYVRFYNSSTNKNQIITEISGSNKVSIAISSKGIAISSSTGDYTNNFNNFIGAVTTIDGETTNGAVFINSNSINIFTDNCTNTNTEAATLLNGAANKTILYPVADYTSGDKFNDIYMMYSTSLTSCIFTLNDKSYVCGQYAALAD